jgi:hypothetical protein
MQDTSLQLLHEQPSTCFPKVILESASQAGLISSHTQQWPNSNDTQTPTHQPELSSPLLDIINMFNAASRKACHSALENHELFCTLPPLFGMLCSANNNCWLARPKTRRHF